MGGIMRFGSGERLNAPSNGTGSGDDALFARASSPSSVPQQGRILVDSDWNEGEGEGGSRTPTQTPEWTNPSDGDPGTTLIVGFHGADDIWL